MAESAWNGGAYKMTFIHSNSTHITTRQGQDNDGKSLSSEGRGINGSWFGLCGIQTYTELTPQVALKPFVKKWKGPCATSMIFVCKWNRVCKHYS
jgi:hypothetical protein